MGLTVHLMLDDNRCDHCGRFAADACAYTDGTTHNLVRMAEEAGIYNILWRPSEVGIEKANQLIEPLGKSIKLLQSDPERFRQFNAKNGWGTYEDFVEFVTAYRNACVRHPDAIVEVTA